MYSVHIDLVVDSRLTFIKVVPLFINLIFESQHVMKSMNKNIKDKDILLQMLSVDIPNWSEHLFILIYKTA